MQTGLEPTYTNSIGDSTSVSALDNINLPRHRWYFVKEAFSPDFVEHAMKDAKLASTDVVFDPFSGSGTVCLSANQKSIKSFGIEVNPFLAFVANTKLRSFDLASLRKYSNRIVVGAREGRKSPLEDFSTFSESAGLKKWLFNNSVLRAFEGGWHETIGIHTSTRDVLRLALIGAALDVANATKDGKCLRYRTAWKDKRFGQDDFVNAYKKRISMIEADLSDSSRLAKFSGRVVNSDIRRYPIQSSAAFRYKLCVTSPPYLNSFDYTDVYRPELFLGKFIDSQQQLRRLRLKTIRSHVQATWKMPKHDDFGDTFRSAFDEVERRKDLLWDSRIPLMIKAYFEDMLIVLRKLRFAADRNASLWLVVSTSAYAGIEIPVDLIVAEIATKVGWYLREVTVLRYLRRVSGQQWSELAQDQKRPYLRESVVILDATPRR